MRGGPRTPSGTTDANLDCAFAENALLFVALKIGRAWPPLSTPLAQQANQLKCEHNPFQVCGDSPNLNLTRRMHPAAVASGTSTVAAPTAGGAAGVLLTTRVPQPQASSGPRPSVSVGALPSAVEAAAAASSTSHLASQNSSQRTVTSSKSVQDVKSSPKPEAATARSTDFQATESFTAEVLF